MQNAESPQRTRRSTEDDVYKISVSLCGLMTAHLDATINRLDDDYHKMIEAYKSIAQKRKILLRQK